MDLPTTYSEKFNPAAAEIKTGEPRSNRDALLNDFLAKLNPDREARGMEPFAPARVAKMLKTAGFDERNWHALYKSCERARSFGALFWSLTHPKV